MKLYRLITKLVSTIESYNRLVYGYEASCILHSPANESQIIAYEEKSGIKLPLSYRRFLLIHNGWQEYAYGFSLVGVSGKHTDEALQDITETIDIVKDEWIDAFGEPTEKAVHKFQVDGDNTNALEGDWSPYVPDKIHVGTDFNGGLIFFDPERTGVDGEMEIYVWHTNCGTQARHDSFEEMLSAHLEALKSEINELNNKGRQV